MTLLHTDKSSILVFLLSVLLMPFSTHSTAGAKDDPLLLMVTIDQLESRSGDESPDVLEADAWIGYDEHKLWLKTEIERVDNTNESAELQLLYGKAVSAYWDFQVGVRRDFDPVPERHWAVVSFQGLAPYYVDIDVALFIGESGHSAFRFEAEYEQMLTQRLALIPELELNFFGKDNPVVDIGSGLANSEFGLRLAYEIRREFAPYIGVNWEAKHGQTKRIAEQHGEHTEDTQFVVGIHAWF
ncbi:copper resistance protein CopB [Candidatus Endobugula sertula]|uniref:Copper resistance protein CopB n=1 Tax=Candidatus Endobugula sertula TaxID=62101 RepID=A0A1D2QQD0_9GAMM|nr:copper resistance protein CopB [Candidatus Endobugula sertula]